MGMLGHGGFVRCGPMGSLPMAALALAKLDRHAGQMTMASGLPAKVSFPLRFPKPGGCRNHAQVQRGGTVLTGMCDARVEN